VSSVALQSSRTSPKKKGSSPSPFFSFPRARLAIHCFICWQNMRALDQEWAYCTLETLLHAELHLAFSFGFVSGVYAGEAAALC
jgi:hypothetical protein